MKNKNELNYKDLKMTCNPNIFDFTTTEEYLTENDALLVCTDGVHDVMECTEWPALKVDMELRAWLLDMKASLDSKQAYDNVSMILVRAKI